MSDRDGNCKRRCLPIGYDEESSVYFIPKPIRKYYETIPLAVTDQPGSDFSRHLTALSLACDLIEHNLTNGHLDEGDSS